MNINKKTLMVDMDNVITDGIFLELINEFTGKTYIRSELKNYYLQELVKDNEQEFWNWVKDKDFYQNAELLDGCYEVLKRLNDMYDIYIVTSYLWKDVVDISGNTLRDKYNYLREKLPFIKPEKYIFTTNKTIINFDIRIDDKIENLAGASIKLLFTAWHNIDKDKFQLENNSIIRVNSWYEIGKILLENE